MSSGAHDRVFSVGGGVETSPGNGTDPEVSGVSAVSSDECNMAEASFTGQYTHPMTLTGNGEDRDVSERGRWQVHKQRENNFNGVSR